MSTAKIGAPEAPARAADRILQSAHDLFYREGIRAVGVDEIVTRAGVTKPSLYRSFPSKDELAASYLRQYEAEFWERFNAAMTDDSDDPRAHLLSYLEGLATRSVAPGYRGCGLSNAAVEYPDLTHPARLVSQHHKQQLRRRLQDMAAQMGARDADLLGDGLLLLLEGAFVSGQLFHEGGPSGNVARAAALLIDASTR